ncbi:hypothetical protein [Parabacteroides sp. FAFU027]|uniref:hypothetical protein n=1 Tax=Parabacteroides sp. FAFU027 TaxID=2922715 RepID=UPI001FB00BE6|nr:hypothetical protein [Parabacteroides sp. FAFU027]
MNELNFNINDTTFGIKGKPKKIKAKHINKLLSFIVNRLVHPKYEESIQNGYIEIPAMSIKKIYDKYGNYMKYFVKKGILERSPYSKVDHKCMGYRFTNDFMQQVQINGIILDEKSTIFDLINNEPIEENEEVVIPTKHTEVLNRLKADFDSVVIDLSHIDKVKVDKTYYIDAGKWFRNVISLNKWEKGGLHITFKFKSNRLYTNFTSLSSHYRKNNVIINGEKLNEFDISSSFPLMLALYAKQQYPDIVKDPDFIRYCTSLKTQSFYDDLKERLNITLNCDSSKQRKNSQNEDIRHRLLSKKAAKKLFQMYLNGDTKRTPYLEGYSNSFIREQFTLMYPELNRIIEEVKNSNQEIYFKLVEIETDFIFSTLEELYLEYPDIRILTCHDAIYVPKSFSERTNIIWAAKMQELYDQLPDEINDIKTILPEEDEGIDVFCVEKDFCTNTKNHPPLYGGWSKEDKIWWDEFIRDEDFDDL